MTHFFRLISRLVLIFAGFNGSNSLAVGAEPAAMARAPRGVEILWDTFGVPHIYAATNEGLFFAHGYAQMQAHGDLILKLYGESRGRAAEYWGEGKSGVTLDYDRWVVTNGVPERGAAWYRQQTPEFRGWLDAFAAGMNAYAEAHPEKLEATRRRVLPITGADPITHALRIMQYSYMSSPARVALEAEAGGAVSGSVPGSNAWALAPSRTTAGHPLLLMNPHLRWEDYFLYMEVQLSGPGNPVYGVSQVGWPVFRFSFNDLIGFTHTVNTIDPADLYRLKVVEGGYEFDGQVKAFATETRTLLVRQLDGTMKEQPLVVRTSVHGPVVWDRDGQVLALRVAGLDRPFALEQLWKMGQSRNLVEYRQQMERLQFPYFNFTSVDAEGHIMYLFNGVVPRRPKGDFAFWNGVVPGDTSATLWNDVLTYAELPKLIDPPTGFVQNSNDPPWSSTYPTALRPEDYPAYVAPRAYPMRTVNSLGQLRGEKRFTFEEFMTARNSTRLVLADRVLDDLAAAVETHGTERARRAIAVLRAWDRTAEANSRGALLFEAFGRRILLPAVWKDFFVVPQNYAEPFATPRGIKDPAAAVALLDEAAAETETRYGALNAPWGEFRRYRRGALDLPANGAVGGLGSFRVSTTGPTNEALQSVVHGDTWVAVVEFAKPTRAKVLISYGNATQPGSKHIEDQLPLLARKEMRDAWLTRKDVEAHLESVDRW